MQHILKLWVHNLQNHISYLIFMTTKLKMKLEGIYVIESLSDLIECRLSLNKQFSSFMLQFLQVGAAVQMTRHCCSCRIDFSADILQLLHSQM